MRGDWRAARVSVDGRHRTRRLVEDGRVVVATAASRGRAGRRGNCGGGGEEVGDH